MTGNLDIIKAHYAASDRGDLDGMLAAVAADARWIEMAGAPTAGDYVGPDAVRAGVFHAIGRDWSSYAFRLERLIDAGDDVIGIGRYEGAYRATGKTFACRVAHVWRLAGGRIIRFEQFADTAEMARAMS